MSDRRKKGKKNRRKEEWDVTRSTHAPTHSHSSHDPERSRLVRIRGRQRWVIVVLVALTYLWLFTKLNWPSTFTDIAEIGARLYAKEYCSCTFVIGQSQSQCKKAYGQIIPAWSIDIRPESKVVEARVLWSTATAMYQGPRLGCVPIEP